MAPLPTAALWLRGVITRRPVLKFRLRLYGVETSIDSQDIDSSEFECPHTKFKGTKLRNTNHDILCVGDISRPAVVIIYTLNSEADFSAIP